VETIQEETIQEANPPGDPTQGLVHTGKALDHWARSPDQEYTFFQVHIFQLIKQILTNW
jgi:hypothetical protein